MRLHYLYDNPLASKLALALMPILTHAMLACTGQPTICDTAWWAVATDLANLEEKLGARMEKLGARMEKLGKRSCKTLQKRWKNKGKRKDPWVRTENLPIAWKNWVNKWKNWVNGGKTG